MRKKGGRLRLFSPRNPSHPSDPRCRTARVNPAHTAFILPSCLLLCRYMCPRDPPRSILLEHLATDAVPFPCTRVLGRACFARCITHLAQPSSWELEPGGSDQAARRRVQDPRGDCWKDQTAARLPPGRLPRLTPPPSGPPNPHTERATARCIRLLLALQRVPLVQMPSQCLQTRPRGLLVVVVVLAGRLMVRLVHSPLLAVVLWCRRYPEQVSSGIPTPTPLFFALCSARLCSALQ